MACFILKIMVTALIFAIAIPTSSARQRRSRRTNDTERYLRDLCSRTERSDVCLNILKTESHRFDSSDEVDVLAGVIDLAIAKSEQIGDQLNQWYKDSNDERMVEKYRSCSKNYREANRYLEDSRRDIDSDDYRRISNQIDDAEDELDRCRREFENSPDPGHVGDRNNELGLYLDMVRAATSLTM